MRRSLLHLPTPAGWKRIEKHPLGSHVYVFQRHAEAGAHLTVTVGDETTGWHLTISHRLNMTDPRGAPLPGRLPMVDEMREAVHNFVPDDVCMAAFFPPEREYVNAHPTTLHLFEVVRPHVVRQTPSGPRDELGGLVAASAARR